MRIDSPESLGQVLRAARRRRGLTQLQLADTVNASRDWVNRVERGSAPRAELNLVLRALASVGLTLNAEAGDALPDLEAALWQDDEALP
jgi:transcriptional regulator with XRE-family HTH domain